ncbi:hypothetical protein [Novosphingobium sp. PASSN1]|uniref:hypothetical protein n=1 Tax=Novosphingobium sp. PASSN1 TaxID=2015561 RepID=UPI0025FA2810|nr:hypothetical protein [Novosphingobium sp. PASSN1]
MPSPLEIARALASVLEAKLADPSAERIELSREEAALCLGVINGVAENLTAGTGNGS